MKVLLKELLRRVSTGKTARELLTEQAMDADRERVNQASLREYHSAMEAMLVLRVARINADLRKYDTTPGT